MKLLLDQNLSYRLVDRLFSVFPGSKHVKSLNLTQKEDELIWKFAADNDFVIVSKDSDFLHRSLLRGHPPKFIHLRVGNCPTSRIHDLLLAKQSEIMDFFKDPIESLLVLE